LTINNEEQVVGLYNPVPVYSSLKSTFVKFYSSDQGKYEVQI